MRRIDLHTHVFNVRYLPVAGILHQRGGLPKALARGIAALLNWRTGDQIGHPAVAAKDAMLAAAEADTANVSPARALAEATPPELIDHPDVREALAMIGSGSPKALFQATNAAFDDAAAMDQFERLYAQVESAQRDSIFTTGHEYLNWLKFLTHSEQVIVDRLLQTYGNDVQLFIHHMMDMQHYYDPGDCHYDFVGAQLDRMKRLVDANKGRLLTFVAWSPKRPSNVGVIQRAIDKGIAAGVKVYPPSGYQPDEAINDSLFDFAISRDVPLFAHCTPEGFEARPGYGKRSDPKFWGNVLHRADKKWSTLRLCLAHAGGDAPWFGTTPWKDSFAERAVQLAVDPKTPNVYLEFGYHDDILNAARRRQFAKILADQIDASQGRLADRIVYGTDWHMIQKIKDHEKYFQFFAEVFSKPPLDAYADRFFYRSAANYLNLGAFAERRAKEDPVRKHVERVMRAAGVRKRGK